MEVVEFLASYQARRRMVEYLNHNDIWAGDDLDDILLTARTVQNWKRLEIIRKRKNKEQNSQDSD